jgi:hypothetical protein
MKKVKINISEERHNREFESLGSVFTALMKDALSAEDIVEVDIILNWSDIVGEGISSYCRPLKAKFNPKNNCRTVYVEVPVGGFALEMQHKEKYVLEKINAYFGYNAVHKLNIDQNMNMQIKSIAKKQEKRELKDSEKKYLSELISDIKEDKLKEILTKLGESVILSNRKENENADY